MPDTPKGFMETGDVNQSHKFINAEKFGISDDAVDYRSKEFYDLRKKLVNSLPKKNAEAASEVDEDEDDKRKSLADTGKEEDKQNSVDDQD